MIVVVKKTAFRKKLSALITVLMSIVSYIQISYIKAIFFTCGDIR